MPGGAPDHFGMPGGGSPRPPPLSLRLLAKTPFILTLLLGPVLISLCPMNILQHLQQQVLHHRQLQQQLEHHRHLQQQLEHHRHLQQQLEHHQAKQARLTAPLLAHQVGDKNSYAFKIPTTYILYIRNCTCYINIKCMHKIIC